MVKVETTVKFTVLHQFVYESCSPLTILKRFLELAYYYYYYYFIIIKTLAGYPDSGVVDFAQNISRSGL